MKMKTGIIIGALTLLLVSGQVHAAPYTFYTISNSNPVDVAIGESQLFMEVIDLGFDIDLNLNQLQFYFTNTGPQQSTITRIFFDDTDPRSLQFVGQETGFTTVGTVKFTQATNLQPAFPNGNSIGFVVDDRYDANNPGPQDGINIGEALGITFNLLGDATYNSIISSLSDGTLRVGLHVTNFASKGSESFVNSPNPIPEPTTLLLFGSGLLGLAGLGRRKRS
ncbi:PEP-CTERM sorting domain-containing protein [Desulfobulbus alkaliphilus]|uniref:PEP-CTERM sorting domain-containing protein n=1 Tax=Desulfobulbus alkaliphilus TaxID=869814 RepID=UPI001963318A|nr:PEP-CTERM sorting domain-containing protein [Desulfobulbus alkaliphilus]MBM9536152.1 PEP-CTERM sorting domain-containing protein [Desulfobulbus alkaliphilus]